MQGKFIYDACVRCSVIGFEIADLGLKQMSIKSIELYNITKNHPEKCDLFCTVTAMLVPVF
jgi:hypothetical protein